MLHNIRIFVTSIAIAVGLTVMLTACQPASTPPSTTLPSATSGAAPATTPAATSSPELEWARAALERNPALKVLSVDSKSNTIKVHERASEAIYSVSPGELAAIPIADLVELQATNASVTARSQTVSEEPADSTAEKAAEKSKLPSNDSATPPNQYTVQRDQGRVRVSGPGVTIESQQSKAEATAATQPAKDEPLICEGRRMMHLDGRKLKVDGDAITVRGGCELHLTNSTIEASGVGIVVDNGSIHIANTTVEGKLASLQMEARAKLYIRNSTFIGISRRDDAAELQDMGGNRWQSSPVVQD